MTVYIDEPDLNRKRKRGQYISTNSFGYLHGKYLIEILINLYINRKNNIQAHIIFYIVDAKINNQRLYIFFYY